ncbi:S8 family serine peptidase [Allokutzneria multivorans]|uniref:S8 family serine peptidase n=1 Tax=Allokutzneria multivorans TaxID=1142134 RepID=A0ABP7SLC1_9PSEU
MNAKRIGRVLLASAVLSAGLLAAPATVTAQQQCVTGGSDIRSVPWPQRLLAPERAWPMTTGSGQKVAVISTGTGDNPLLSGKVADSTTLARADGRNASGKPDCMGTGTGVAGIIAAASSTGVGFHGVAPDVALLSAKVVADSYTSGGPPKAVEPGLLAEAVDWAVGKGASVIAVAEVAREDSAQLRQAVQNALAKGAVVVAATGEPAGGDSPYAGKPTYPASQDGVLAVGAIDEGGLLAPAASKIDIVAPGLNVLTTAPGGGLATGGGSSFAAGYVAAAAALVRAYWPTLSNAEVVKRLRATTTPANVGPDLRVYGDGIVNPYQAVIDQMAKGGPAVLPPLKQEEPSAEEKARTAAEDHARAWGFGAAGIGVGMAGLVIALAIFWPKGRRRGWRSGLAPDPVEHPEDELPQPPAELFGGRAGNS